MASRLDTDSAQGAGSRLGFLSIVTGLLVTIASVGVLSEIYVDADLALLQDFAWYVAAGAAVPLVAELFVARIWRKARLAIGEIAFSIILGAYLVYGLVAFARIALRFWDASADGPGAWIILFAILGPIGLYLFLAIVPLGLLVGWAAQRRGTGVGRQGGTR